MGRFDDAETSVAFKKAKRPVAEDGQLCAGRLTRGTCSVNSVQITLHPEDWGERFFIGSEVGWLGPRMRQEFVRAFGEGTEGFDDEECERLQEIVKEAVDKAGYSFRRQLYTYQVLIGTLDAFTLIPVILAKEGVFEDPQWGGYDLDNFILLFVMAPLTLLFLLVSLPTLSGCGVRGPYSYFLLGQKALANLRDFFPQMLAMEKEAPGKDEGPARKDESQFWGDFSFLATWEQDTFSVACCCWFRHPSIEYPVLHICRIADLELLGSAQGEITSEPFLGENQNAAFKQTGAVTPSMQV